jgi:hypothetical protein
MSLASVSRVVTPSDPPAFIWAARAVSLAYLVGLFAGLGWLALGCLILSMLTRRADEPSRDTRSLYEGLAFESRWRRPRLLISYRVRRPVLVGAFRPLILIPPELERPAASGCLRLSLLHELAHAERADPYFGLLGSLARALWFFSPPLWWVSAQVRLDQEFLADRRAAVGFGPVREYASSLLEFASTRSEDPALVVSSSPGSNWTGSPLFLRVLMLLRCPFPVEARAPRWWSWGLPCLTVAVTLGVSSLSMRPPVAKVSVGPQGHTFRVARLETYLGSAGPHGRAPLYELPLRLPDRFDLTLEVWGNPSTLSSTRVTGLPLGPTSGSPASEQNRWHTVRVRRDEIGVRLWVDTASVACGRNRPALTSWLSVEAPPEQPGSFRNLTLTW